MSSADVAIVGAGPAGLAAAGKLARLGRRVIVFSRVKANARARLESMPDLKVLCHAFPELRPESMRGAVGPLNAGENWWTGRGQDMPAVWFVDRAAFDFALIEETRRAGVEIRWVGTGALRIAPCPEGWLIRVGEETTVVRRMLDATGRHSALRRRRSLVEWRQVAITAEWGSAPDGPAVWIESLRESWLWGVRHADGRFALSVFCDPRRLREGAEATWRHALGESRLAPVASRWKAAGRFSTCEATPVATAEAPDSSAVLSIGDAALARDPLASQGLIAGISDGLAAAVGLHTVLGDSSSGGLVDRFFAENRARAILRHQQALAAAYATAPQDSPFWAVRRGAPVATAAEASQRFFSWDGSVVLSPCWKLDRAGILKDDAIAEGEVLYSTNNDDPVAWLEGNPVRKFLPLAPGRCPARSLVLGWIDRGLVSGSKAPRLLHWMIRRGILVPALPSETGSQVVAGMTRKHG